MVTCFTSSHEASIDPTANSDRPAPFSVWHSASAAAIFIGCWSTMIWPCQWPLAHHRRTGHEDRDQGQPEGRPEGRHRVGVVAAPGEVPGGHREDEAPGHQPGTGDDVREGRQCGDVGQHRGDAVELGPAGRRVEAHSDRVLHERVGSQDEVRREVDPEREQPDRRQVHPSREPVPAEDPQPEERRLEEEGRQPLHRQRRPEDVTDEARVAAPVHAELELLHDAGDHAQGEVDQQQLAEELGQPQPRRVAGAVPDRLHDRDDRREPDGQRDEEEVVDGDDAELPPGQVERAHGRRSFRPGPASGGPKVPS